MIIDALDRTLLLMRTDLGATVTNETLLTALRSTRVVLAADEASLATHSGQSAFVTAATLMARSGHRIWLIAPEVRLLGAQPPLRGDRLLAALRELGEDLLPDWRFEEGAPPDSVDLVVQLGMPAVATVGGMRLCLDACDWSARTSPAPGRWTGGEWPVGGLAAAALSAGEAFKVAMRKLRGEAAAPPLFDELYAPCPAIAVELAPEGTPKVAELGRFDLVSAGAIANAALYALLRLPNVSGAGRVMDKDRSALSNLNRNAQLRRSRLDLPKVNDLASYSSGLAVEPLEHRYSGAGPDEPELADVVLVGVDHIPSRWAVQRRRPRWLGIGASEGFAVQVSFHADGTACAQCLHPEEAPPGGEIPTVAFVSFWAGLLLAVSFLRFRSGERRSLNEQNAYFPTLRPESWASAYSPVAMVVDCPTCKMEASAAQAA